MAETDLQVTMYAGNRKVLRFTILNSDTPGPLNLAGMTVKFGVCSIGDNGPNTSDLLIDLTTGAQVVTTDAPNGKVSVTLLKAHTDGIPPGDYYLELEVYDSSSNQVVVSTGTLTILPNLRNA